LTFTQTFDNTTIAIQTFMVQYLIMH